MLAICAALALSPSFAAGEEKAPEAFPRKTFTYKTAGDLAIQADVYGAGDDQIRPVVAWLHGGALIVGSRADVPRRLLELCRKEGFVLVSFDYRLAPETRLPAIIEDLEDACRWLRRDGPKLLRIDPDRLVVAGGSAGGYLAMTAGARVRPRPRAVVAYWGYGDVDGDWYTKPSEHYRSQAPLVEKEEAYRPIGRRPLAGTEAGSPDQQARGRFYLYLRQQGLWTREVTGFDPVADRARLDPYCPVRNITPDYPPILMLHGTKDDDVPHERSADMARELARQGVPHELVTVPGAGHGLGGGDPEAIDAAHEKALAFIRKHLK